MPKHEIEITRSAEKTLRTLPRDAQRRVLNAVLELVEEPRPRQARKLTGYDDVFRLRVGRYRVLYSVEDQTLVVLILKIGHRRDVYR